MEKYIKQEITNNKKLIDHQEQYEMDGIPEVNSAQYQSSLDINYYKMKS